MRGFRRLRSGRCWALAWCICFSLCLLASTPRIYAETSSESAPDWPELLSNLDEIEQGLLMTDAPLNLIESSFVERELALQKKEKDLSASEERLQKREQGLNVREQGLEVRETGLADMQTNLDRANKKLKHGWIWLLLAALVGGGLGYAIGR